MSEPKKLYRSRTNRKIAGVCGGLGDYFNIDPTLIRLGVVFFTLWWGGGLLLYLLAWFLIPEEPAVEIAGFLPEDNEGDPRQTDVLPEEAGQSSGA
jgi:phage shock protein PspC (stress-responsive transcriptional regulator)